MSGEVHRRFDPDCLLCQFTKPWPCFAHSRLEPKEPKPDDANLDTKPVSEKPN